MHVSNNNNLSAAGESRMQDYSRGVKAEEMVATVK